MDELKRLLQEFSQKYGELGERIAKDIWTLVGQGKTPEEAVKLVLDANHLEDWLSETISSIVIQTASTQLSPSLVAAITVEEFKRTLSLPWDGSGMTLSEKIHGAGLEIRKRITSVLKEQLQWNQTTRQMAQALYDGYYASHVTHQQALPKYVQKLMTAYRRNQGAISPKDYEAIMRQLRNVQRQYDGLVNDTVTYNHFKTTLAGLTDAILKGNDKAVWNALWQAVQEKSRYVAERIARTEGARAWYDGFQAQYGTDDRVPAYRWRLGSRHPHFDICDLYAEADLYGLGKGIFPKDKAPPLPAHPHCLCHYSPIYASELAGKKEKDQVQAGGMDFINKMKPIDRMALLGRAGIKGVAEGREWTKYARGYSTNVMASRMNWQSGALDDRNDPDYTRRDKHAALYYAEIRNNGRMTFVNKISANTGLSKRFVGEVFDHVFVDEHLLDRGYGKLDESYYMAISFQRLLQNSFDDVDILLLHHEHLERALEKRYNLNIREAHNMTVRKYDYEMALRRSGRK